MQHASSSPAGARRRPVLAVAIVAMVAAYYSVAVIGVANAANATVSVAATTITYTAGADQVNLLSVTGSGNTYTFTDTAGARR